MNAHSIRLLAAPTLLVVLGLGLLSCGGDDESPTSATPPPDVRGRYFLEWNLQVLRMSDGFQKGFNCYGYLTLVQGSGTAAAATSLSGFATVEWGTHDLPCARESSGLIGSVNAVGAIEFTTGGPKPPEGPCPGGSDVHFSGLVTSTGSAASGRTVTVSARGVTTVTCPQFGDHQFTYLIRATR